VADERHVEKRSRLAGRVGLSLHARRTVGLLQPGCNPARVACSRDGGPAPRPSAQANAYRGRVSTRDQEADAKASRHGYADACGRETVL
jgi:hypothetical protein